MVMRPNPSPKETNTLNEICNSTREELICIRKTSSSNTSAHAHSQVTNISVSQSVYTWSSLS